MKIIFTVLTFITFFKPGFCQNYNTIVQGDTSYYLYLNNSFDPSQSKQTETAVWIDSIGTATGGTSLFNYRRFDYFNLPGGGCDSSTRISCFGTHLVQFSNGYDVFITENGDSVFVNRLAVPGANWVFYRFPNGDYLQATLNSITQGSFLGINDSIKTISLQTKNSGSANIPGYYNGKELWLSNNHGLVKTFGYRFFPGDTTVYELSGWSGNTAGFQNITANEIFNFDIGDEFHYHNLYSFSVLGQDHYYIEWHVLNKTVSLNNDTITYEMDNTWYKVSFYMSTVTTSFIHDTIPFTVILSDLQHLSSLSEQLFNTSVSMNPVHNYGFVIPFHDTSYFARERKYCEDFWEYDSLSNCYVWPLGSGIFPNRIFVNGLGEVYETDWTFNMRYDSLVYYKKGLEEWGQPLNWSVLLGVNEQQDNERVMLVFPNPAVDYFEIKYEPSLFDKSELILFNPLGTFISRIQLSTSGHTRIETMSIPNGIYFYETSDKSGNIYTGKIVISGK